MTHEEQEALVNSLSTYDDYAKMLEAHAEYPEISTTLLNGRDFDASALDELRSILRDAAQRLRITLQDKLSELPPDIDKDLLRAYGLD